MLAMHQYMYPISCYCYGRPLNCLASYHIHIYQRSSAYENDENVPYSNIILHRIHPPVDRTPHFSAFFLFQTWVDHIRHVDHILCHNPVVDKVQTGRGAVRADHGGFISSIAVIHCFMHRNGRIE
jgi:hypothetical protein